jgi:hypothetical protein
MPDFAKLSPRANQTTNPIIRWFSEVKIARLAIAARMPSNDKRDISGLINVYTSPDIYVTIIKDAILNPWIYHAYLCQAQSTKLDTRITTMDASGPRKTSVKP